jgi:hypothetical protein
MNMKIDLIWTTLETNSGFQNGLLYKRYAADIPTDLFVGIRGATKQRWIGIGHTQGKLIASSKWEQLQDIKVENRTNPSGQPPYLLTISLENPVLKDIFSIVCTDLLTEIAPFTNDNAVLKNILKRLEKWQLLFEKYHADGLTVEAQQGLYGELYFLRTLLQKDFPPQCCLQSWKGVEAHFHDFHWQQWAVEIKTSTPKKANSIHISSEKQLDDTGLDFLGLCHYILDNQSNTGETLNEIVESIEHFLTKSSLLLVISFKNKLLEVGYFKEQEPLYKTTFYTMIMTTYYQINENFPRLIPRVLPFGVENVKYVIHTQSFKNHQVNELDLFKKIL